MKFYKLMDGERVISEILSDQDLEKKLIEIRDSPNYSNPILTLVDPLGNTLTIGISKNLGFLNFIDSSGNPPYFSSVGNRSLSETNEIMVFYIEGKHFTEVPKRNCIPIETLIEVTKEYIKTGNLSTVINWEKD